MKQNILSHAVRTTFLATVAPKLAESLKIPLYKNQDPNIININIFTLDHIFR